MNRKTEELEEIITRYVNTSNSLYFKSDENININDILPVIKDYRFVAHLKEINPDFEQHIIFEKYNEELFIFYVEDSETNISYLNKEDLATLNISFIDLKSKAITWLYFWHISIRKQRSYLKKKKRTFQIWLQNIIFKAIHDNTEKRC